MTNAFHLSQDHPFMDGRKQVTLTAVFAFLDRKGVTFSDPHNRLDAIMRSVALGKAQRSEIAALFRELARTVKA